ncbi:MAG: MarR family transcriptional regulator [Acidimicrobiaceae bacterium]|mgnify:FL=1|jgi:DNA-binding MarR family transcriptional regulator|nr:MarR family transcriptional regulator [Acidimicrobiaceae bacterium]MBT5581848.1 MarR family transcriptional regulator [Acidimicrobiaceae bacterium]MBT5850492.1 MarR family transcriptional regulator [Acidimicrobiaceae bacterium]
MKPAETSFLANYLPYLLRQADQTLSAPFYAVLTKHEVARSEWRVLAVLEEFEELSVIELADASLSPQPTVTHAVRRLEGRGLVTRTQGTEDRRQRIVSITAAGIKLARLLAREAKMLEADALANAGDLSALVAQLEILSTCVATRMPQRGNVSA